MKLDKEKYQKKVLELSPSSPVITDTVKAFAVGGLICAFGQVLSNLYMQIPLDGSDARLLSSVTLILLAAFLTGIGVFDKIAKFAGAGTLVPITGFANSIVSPAVEYKTEGQVAGLGVKMFTIAGPVLVYGISASVLYGIVLYIIEII